MDVTFRGFSDGFGGILNKYLADGFSDFV